MEPRTTSTLLTLRKTRIAAFVGALLITLLTVACGSADEAAPALAPAVTPTSVPATVAPGPTALPEPTSAPEPTATPEPEYVPGPREATFADGQFKVNFLYRSDPELARVIDVVDVESTIRPMLGRIAALQDGKKPVLNLRGPVTTGLIAAHAARLKRDGYVILMDLGTFRIDVRINPNGPIAMKDFWRTVLPAEVASWSVFYSRLQEGNGTWGDSLLDIMVARGLGTAFEAEVIPDVEERLRELRPEYAAVIYDLSSDAERELWAAALPDLDTLGVNGIVVNRFFAGYGGGTAEFPDGAGHAMGLRIVEAYQENNPGVTASSLIRVSTEEIMEGANYNP